MEGSAICSLGRDRWGSAGRDQSEMGKGHMAHDGSMASEMLLSLAGNNLLKATFACCWSCSNKQVIKY